MPMTEILNSEPVRRRKMIDGEVFIAADGDLICRACTIEASNEANVTEFLKAEHQRPPAEPRRRYFLRFTGHSDGPDELASMLHELLSQLERGVLPARGVTGGYSSGFSIEYEVDPAMTHETYSDALNRYIAHLKSLRPTPIVT